MWKVIRLLVLGLFIMQRKKDARGRRGIRFVKWNPLTWVFLGVLFVCSWWDIGWWKTREDFKGVFEWDY